MASISEVTTHRTHWDTQTLLVLLTLSDYLHRLHPVVRPPSFPWRGRECLRIRLAVHPWLSLPGADLSGCNLKGCKFVGTNLEEAILPEGMDRNEIYRAAARG